jgi:hypothetical protein
MKAEVQMPKSEAGPEARNPNWRLTQDYSMAAARFTGASRRPAL